MSWARARSASENIISSPTLLGMSHSSSIHASSKDVDHPNRIVLADPVFQAFRKQRALPAIRALNEALHLIPP
jgi:hypothetical protein